MNTYGVICKGAHLDVSDTEAGAKRYATLHGFDTVTIRYNLGYVAQEIAIKKGNKWVKINNQETI